MAGVLVPLNRVLWAYSIEVVVSDSLGISLSASVVPGALEKISSRSGRSSPLESCSSLVNPDGKGVLSFRTEGGLS